MAIHETSGRRLSYAGLIGRAGTLTVPQNPALKDPKDFTLVGKPLKRLDTPDKVNGKAVYGIDVDAARRQICNPGDLPQYLAGKSVTWTTARPGNLRGVRQVVVLE